MHMVFSEQAVCERDTKMVKVLLNDREEMTIFRREDNISTV